nr:amidophosphoribosyltransferase [Nanoarchaeota archaeon]
MSLFGVASKGNCYSDLFYGTDYQSHKSQEYGGLAFLINNGKNIGKKIRDIGETQFKAKFSEFEGKINSKYGIGVISPKDEQPITLDGKVANLAICTEGRIDNIDQLSRELKDKGVSFNEKTDGE